MRPTPSGNDVPTGAASGPDRIRFVRERLAREIAGSGDPDTILRLMALLDQLLNGARKVDGEAHPG